MFAARGLILVGLTVAAPSVLAQDAPPISTDRPGVTDSTSQMAPGAVQLETGVLYTPGWNRIDVAPNQLRMGATPGLELRVGLPGFVGVEGAADGFVDGHVALRFRLRGSARQGGAAPLLQATVGTTLPSGSGDYGVETGQPFGQVVATWLTGAATTLNVMVQVAGPWDGAERWVQTIASSSFYVTVHQDWSVFVEPALITGLSADGGSRWILDGGVVWLATRALQLDVTGGVNLEGGTATAFFGAGIATRF